VSYLGDVTGDGRYQADDAMTVRSMVVGLLNHFSAYPQVDPVLVADVSGNGVVSSLDAALIGRQVECVRSSSLAPAPSVSQAAGPLLRIEPPTVPTGPVLPLGSITSPLPQAASAPSAGVSLVAPVAAISASTIITEPAAPERRSAASLESHEVRRQ